MKKATGRMVLRRTTLAGLGCAAAALALSLAGTAPSAAADKFKIGFSQGTLHSSWRVQMVERNKAFAEKSLPDVELIITNGDDQATKQVADVESLLAQDIDVLMISPVTAEALTPIVKVAMDKGIPVLTMDRKVNTDVTTHVGAQNRPIGEAAARFVGKLLDGKGAVIEIQGTAGASATVDRHDGFTEVIQKEFPGITIAASQICNYTREPALKFMEDMLQRFGPGQIQAVYAHNDEMALGAVTALEAAGRLGEVKVIGIDGQETAYEAIKNGKMTATFTYHFVAPEGVQYAYQLAKGEALPKEIVLDSKQVDASNVDKFLGTGF
jgi:ribose transport system substrate-binding protein